MTDFFERLAERLQGRDEHAIRPALRPPFRPPPELDRPPQHQQQQLPPAVRDFLAGRDRP